MSGREGGTVDEPEVHRYWPQLPKWPDHLMAAFAVIELGQFAYAALTGRSWISHLVWSAIFITSYLALRSGAFVRVLGGRGGLEIGASGLRVGLMVADWDEIAAIESRPTVLGRTRPRDVFVLKHPKPISRLLRVSGEYSTIPLGDFRRDWRSSPMGSDIERWAPHLLSHKT